MHAATNPAGPAAPRAAAAATDLFASIDATVAPISGRECVLRNAGSGATEILPIAAVETLDLCREFRTLDEHAGLIAQLQPQLQRESLRHGLGTLAERGLLVRAEDFLANLTSVPAEELAPLRGIVIRACDRPQQVHRLLATLAACEATHRRRRHYVVLDDSRDPANAAAHADLLAGFARETGAEATHVDAAHTARIVETLARARPEARRVLDFLLARGGADEVGFGGGKGYNVAALLGAGARYVLLDDDFMLPLRRPHDVVPGLQLVPRGEMPAWFHASADAALAAGEALASDPFEVAMQTCGARLGHVLAQDDYRLRPEDLCGFAPSRAPHLGAATRLPTVTHGHRGHSGAPSSGWMLLLEGTARNEFWRDEDGYHRNLEGQGLWYGPSQARLLAHANFTPFAIDASTLVAPTMPGGRSEDLLFGAVTAALYPCSAALHTVYTIGHLQEAVRPRNTGFAHAITPACNQFMGELVNGQAGELRAAEPALRCLAIAAMLRDAAEAAPARRVALIADYLRFVRADMSSRLERARANAGSAAPDYWRRDVDAAIEAQRRALVVDALPRFSDWSDVASDGAAAQRLHTTLHRYAETLEHWPALFEAASGLAPRLIGKD